MQRLLIFLVLASPVFAQSGMSGDASVTSSSSGSIGSIYGSRALAPGPVTAYLPESVTDVTPPDTSGYTVLPDTTSYADLLAKVNCAASGGGGVCGATLGCDTGGTTGYVINIPQGVTYSVAGSGGLVLKPTTCTVSYIVIQTKGLDWTSPPWTRGIRIDPSLQAGILAKITSPFTGAYVISTQIGIPGVSHYWFRGLDLEITALSGIQYIADLTPTVSGTGWTLAQLPDHIIFDHIYAHGRVTNNALGILLGGNYEAVVDSWLSDFKSVSNDTQAISGFAGSPWLIENNFLEASGENILYGGSNIGAVNTTEGKIASDVTEQFNWYFKPLQWQAGATGVVFAEINRTPFAWDVKNIHEYKSCQRCLVQYSILENNWRSAQSGVNTAHDAAPNGSRFGQVSDITEQYLHVIGGTAPFVAQALTNFPDAGITYAPRTFRLSFRHILVEGLSQENRGLVSSVGPLALDTTTLSGGIYGITLDHITITAPRTVNRTIFWSNPTAMIYSDVFMMYFSNNILSATPLGFRTGGTTVRSNNPADALVYWGGLKAPDIHNNVITEASLSGPPALNCATWFDSTQCPATMNDVGFVNWTAAQGGDYHLTPGSDYSATGIHPCHENPDGTGPLADCGADIDTIMAMTAGVDDVPSLWPDSRSGGGILLTPDTLTCNNSNTVVITPIAGTQGGAIFNQSGLDVMFHGTVIVPTASSTTSITIKPPTYSGAVASITATDIGSLAANLAKYTAANTLLAGDLVTVTGTNNPGDPSHVLNVTNAMVHSSTSTQFTVGIVHANVTTAADTGSATSKLAIAVNFAGLPLTASLTCQ